MILRSLSLALSLSCFCAALSKAAEGGPVSISLGEIVYDNTGSGGTQVYYPTTEFGDEVLPKPPPTGESWILTDVFIEYYGDFTMNGDEQARVRLYDMQFNEARRFFLPTGVFYDSGSFSLEPGFQTRQFSGLNIPLPDDLTWTVQFAGLRGVAGDRAGVVIRPSPEVGRELRSGRGSPKDAWSRDANGNWQLQTLFPPNPNLPPDPVTNPQPVANFGARLVARLASAEPPPKLQIKRDDDKIVIEWTGSARLQSSDEATGGYADVANATSPHAVKLADASKKFWRLVK